MDLQNVRMFVKVAELGSFTRAAAQLGVPKSRVSLRINALETELGTRLLQRTTRAVALTPDGEQFFARGKQLVADAEDLSAMFQAARVLRGRVRIDTPIALARNWIIPRLPELLAQHPQLELVLSTTDQRVDLIAEGFDCVLRIGTLVDSALVARKLGTFPMMNCASPAYLRKHGTPTRLADLDRHHIIHYSLSLGGDESSFEWWDGARWASHPMKSFITVNNTDAYISACIAGLGIIQVPRVGMQEALRQGQLIEVLPDLTCAPMPVSLVHSKGRLPKRVSTVMNFLAKAMEPALNPPTADR